MAAPGKVYYVRLRNMMLYRICTFYLAFIAMWRRHRESKKEKDNGRSTQLRCRTLSDPPPTDAMDMVSVGVTESETTTMTSMTLTHLLMLNAIVCGLEFCASSAFCYIPPLLLKAGISEQSMSMILGVGPTLGFFAVPMIGRASDRCRSRYGRRRPFIFSLSLILLAALFVIPYGHLLCKRFFGRASELGATIGVGTMVIGSIMLDFSCQTCLTPCEALLSDLSRGTNQHARCFTVYSFMVSIGGCVGYLITSVDWSSNPLGRFLGGQERSVFIVLVILFSFSFLMTFGAAHEVPLIDDVPPDPHLPSAVANKNSDSVEPRRLKTNGDLELNGIIVKPSFFPPVPKALLTGTLISFLMSIVSRLATSAPFRNLSNVPFVLKRLALANFCSWTAIMGFNLFFTDFVGQAIYGGDPGAPEGSDLRGLYDHGVRIGSFGLLLHCVNSALYAGFVEKFAARFDLRLAYIAGMATFVVAMFLMTLTQDIYVVNFMAALTGVAYATLTTTPFMLVTSYHEDEKLFFHDTGDGTTTPVRGMGTDFATLDSAYYLSQVILTAFMGYIVHWTGTVLAYVVVAGTMGVLACICASRIVASKSQMQQFINCQAVRARTS